jgi:predicted RNA-binding Zn-ribbon protein involved in translation (DUF1610 family)
MSECPNCGEPDPILYDAEDDTEVAMWSCPECGWEAPA